jgi:enamine deaminase RidA (YjgF/YER057c/UK114 family)
MTVKPAPSPANSPMPSRTLLPEGWPAPRGYANGMMAEGKMVILGGQIGWDVQGVFPDGMVAQVRQTLENIMAVLTAAGAGPEHLVRLTWYVTDMAEYTGNLKGIGAAYREVLGPHYPAMTLVQVVRLVEEAAMVEIEGTAILP